MAGISNGKISLTGVDAAGIPQVLELNVSGNTLHVAAAEFDVSKVPIVASLNGGNHVSVPVTAGALYRVDSDINVHLKSSISSALFGATLDDGADGYRVTSVDFSANSEFNILSTTSDAVTYQWWGAISVDRQYKHRALTLGGGSNSLLSIEINRDTGEFWQLGIVLKDTNGVNVLNEDIITTTVSDGAEHCFTYIIDRANTRCAVYVDKTKIYDSVAVVDTGESVDFTIPAQNLGIGTTSSGAAYYGGNINDCQLYDVVLTESQINARVDNGAPLSTADLVMDAATVNNLKFWLSFQNFSIWDDPTEPQPVAGYGGANLVFTKIGTPTIALQTGGVAATPLNSSRILAGNPEVIKIGATDTFLNLYSLGGSAGFVRLTEV